MPVKPLSATSLSMNGLGTFMLPCKKIVLQYCNWNGSAEGMRQFILNELKDYAASNPKIEFNIIKKTGHPVVKGYYPYNQVKSICVRNLKPFEIKRKLDLIKNNSSAQLTSYKNNVTSKNKNPRGIWSPFHVAPSLRHKI
ncbi:mitochondrial 54S ribosomal protein mL43 [Ascoidea rubescens DSM 1968]|uniref:Large ribosomal subunit protein mL43 n=1 Tax=Ascoidea rubescens DSM 1968 TaxID=1344418 RepID=A0A1D2VS76_9ASCO|nr:mitochondrial ribosomal protein of the large subunit [Ascoidea rubescens DSM 1968]ODV64450.1 mitochondrial ribosomal protein of the large subunit [Ascoidea rubescens DSM 1968]